MPTDTDFQRDLLVSLAEEKLHRRQADLDLSAIKTQLETGRERNREDFKTLEEGVAEVRKLAQDAMTVSVGHDGKNGLRSVVYSLVDKVDAICRDFEMVRQTAQNYTEMKSWLVRFCISASLAFLTQFGMGMWHLSAQNSKQETIRTDLNRVISYIEQLNTTKPKPATQP